MVIVRVPPLRERLSDIPLLAEHFVHKVATELRTRPVKFQKGVIERLMAHSWTGNVRELENVIVEAVVRARGHVILTEDIDAILDMNEELPLAGLDTFSLEHMEKQHIAETLRQLAWNRTKAAQLLGISLPTLRSKIRKYDIAPPLLA